MMHSRSDADKVRHWFGTGLARRWFAAQRWYASARVLLGHEGKWFCLIKEISFGCKQIQSVCVQV
ncbi:MAG: hypothetical protein EBT56_07290 [Betaproteobacteria bacterium]|nr:hypothetical protein [Betaproteobacteria bacterium]